MADNRAGRYEIVKGGDRVFFPEPLPPDPPFMIDGECNDLLAKANRAIAKLDGITSVLPNPDLFITMFVRKESLISSQIEGTVASLDGVLEFEADLTPRDEIKELKDVVNYIKALDYGLSVVEKEPITLELIKEMHALLLENVRGSEKTPCEFKRAQNYIVRRDGLHDRIVFTPPPPDAIPDLMKDLAAYINQEDKLPHLIRIALIHAQFETIHPFRDGNGRMGRALITLYLVSKKLIEKPLLYLSFYLKRFREEYYDLLMAVRNDGDWEGWAKFFIEGVIQISAEAANTAREIIDLKTELTEVIYRSSIQSKLSLKLLDTLFLYPKAQVRSLAEKMGVSSETVRKLVKGFEELGILVESAEKERYKSYSFEMYLKIIRQGTEVEEGGF